MGSESSNVCPFKRDTHGVDDVKTEAGIVVGEVVLVGVVVCKPENSREATRSWRRSGKNSPQSRWSTVLLTPEFQTFSLENCERIDFYFFKPPSLR